MKPKVIEKMVRRHLLEHAISMAGTVKARGVQEPFFQERGATLSP